MSLIQWDETLSVGVQSIDAQHTALIEILNELHDAMLHGDAHSKTGPLLRKLLSYTKEHFGIEEAMMEAAGYPQLDEHRAHHRKLTAKVEDFIVRFEQGETTLNLHLLNFLRDWLTSHILREDKAYVPSMNEHDIH